MYVRMYVHTYVVVCTLYTYVHMYVCIVFTVWCMPCMYNICVTYVHICYLYTHMYVCTWVCMYVCTHVGLLGDCVASPPLAGQHCNCCSGHNKDNHPPQSAVIPSACHPHTPSEQSTEGEHPGTIDSLLLWRQHPRYKLGLVIFSPRRVGWEGQCAVVSPRLVCVHWSSFVCTLYAGVCVDC